MRACGRTGRVRGQAGGCTCSAARLTSELGSASRSRIAHVQDWRSPSDWLLSTRTAPARTQGASSLSSSRILILCDGSIAHIGHCSAPIHSTAFFCDAAARRLRNLLLPDSAPSSIHPHASTVTLPEHTNDSDCAMVRVAGTQSALPSSSFVNSKRAQQQRRWLPHSAKDYVRVFCDMISGHALILARDGTSPLGTTLA